MKIAFCSSEVFGFAKTGGLADVSAALPKALVDAGCEVKIFLPLYKGIEPQKMMADYGVTRQGNIEVFFIKNDGFFLRDSIYTNEAGHDYEDSLERFSFLSKRTLEVLKEINFSPDIMHVNDWQTSLISVYLKTIFKKDPFFKNTKSVLTIHNLAYQGLSDKGKFSSLGISDKYFDVKYLEFYDKINLLKGGIVFSDIVTTVSPTYALQIKTPEYGCGLEGVLKEKKDSLVGILNAIDYGVWDPANDDLIYKKYSSDVLSEKQVNKISLQKELGLKEDKDTFLLGMVSRLAEQKGIDILSVALDSVLEKNQVVILGLGEPKYHEILKQKQQKFNSFSLNLEFDETLAHKIYAGCDAFLLPSRFEPCGLSQMISYKYATVPIAHYTGGLIDTVVDVSCDGGGFLFNEYTAKSLTEAINRAKETFENIKIWQQVLQRIVKYDFSWSHAAQQYMKIYVGADRCVRPL